MATESLDTIERHFQECSEKALAAERETKALLKLIGRVQKAFQTGDVSSAEKGVEEIRGAESRLAEAISGLTGVQLAVFTLKFREEAYFREVAALAASRGLSGVRSTEGKLFSYPYVVERKKGSLALSIGSKNTKNIRPNAVVDALAAARRGGSRFDHRVLLDAIEHIYDLRIRGQSTDLVDIEEVYSILTLMPGSDKDYPFLDFLATLDELKRSGLTTQKSGRALDLPAPSTTGKGGRALRVIREDGREQLYRMLRFVSRSPVASVKP